MSNLFTSPCCHAFCTYNGDIIICTNCQQIVKKLGENEELTIEVAYNVEEGESMSGDLLKDRKIKSTRQAHDITLELTKQQCPKCSGYSRLSRDDNGIKFFVCSKCRHVFD